MIFGSLSNDFRNSYGGKKMIQLQYSHPISGKCTCRYFKTYEGMFRHLKKFNYFISYCYIDDNDDEPEFHYDFIVPDGFDWLYLVMKK